MKHFTLKKQLFSLLLLTCLGGNAALSQESCNNLPVNLPGGEPRIDLKRYIKPASDVQKQRSRFQAQFKCKINGQDSDLISSSEKIKMSALLPLYKASKDAADEYRKQHPGTATVTALRILFGMKGNEVVFFYQPVFLHGIAGRKRFQGDREDVPSSPFYSYNAASKTFVPATTDPLLKSYQDQIRIQHRRNGSFEEIVNETTWKGDSRSIIFSFQEIFKLYENTFNGESDGNRYCKEIAINNGAANYRRKILGTVNPLQRTRTKHTLFITGVMDGTAASGEALMAAPDGANLAHLCPPSCNEINYTLQQQQ